MRRANLSGFASPRSVSFSLTLAAFPLAPAFSLAAGIAVATHRVVQVAGPELLPVLGLHVGQQCDQAGSSNDEMGSNGGADGGGMQERVTGTTRSPAPGMRSPSSCNGMAVVMFRMAQSQPARMMTFGAVIQPSGPSPPDRDSRASRPSSDTGVAGAEQRTGPVAQQARNHVIEAFERGDRMHGASS